MLYPIVKELNMTLLSNSILKTGYLVACVISATLVNGCGGGGGGGGGSTAAPTPAAVAAVKMEDLVVPDGFSYDPMGNYTMDIDISNISTERAFVSVYSRFSARDDSSYKPDYSSKVIAGSMNGGEFNSNFSAPSVNEEFLVEVWFFDNQPPLQRVFSTANAQILW